MLGNILGKRDLTSRRGEITTSVIGKSGRVHVNMVVDREEQDTRLKRLNDQSKSFTKVYDDGMSSRTVNLINEKTVGSVQETEPAVYYAPYRPTDDKGRNPMVGRQRHFWTAINGICIPRVTGIDKLWELPFEVRLEFIQKHFLLRGLVVTSWEEGSKAAQVTPWAVPVAKAGTVMVHPMYPTSILAGDAVGITFPSDDDIKSVVNTPNREEEKLLCAYKSMREIEGIHNRAIFTVLESAKRVSKNPPMAGKYTSTSTSKTTGELDRYTAEIMNCVDDTKKILIETTTPFKLLWHAMKQYHVIAVATDYARQITAGAGATVDPTKGRLNATPDSAFLFVEYCVEHMMKSQKCVHEAFSERRQMLYANQVGNAITSANQGQPLDMLIGRGQSI